jgi:hypothetical protein
VIGEPRDRGAYGIAIASIGLALSVAILSIAWTTIENDSTTKTAARGCSIHLKKCQAVEITSSSSDTHTPDGLWIVLAGLGGALVGTLIPFSLRCKPRYLDENECGLARVPWAAILAGGLVLAAALTALIMGRCNDDSLVLYAMGAAFSGLFFGLFVPSPGRRE